METFTNTPLIEQIQGSDPLLRDVRHAEEHGPTVGLRVKVTGPFGVQEVDPDEHAVGQRGQGQLHNDPLLAHPREPEHQNEVGGGDGSGKNFSCSCKLSCFNNTKKLFLTTIQLFRPMWS